MRAIIMAGGKGIRLKPFTTLIPKPLVPIGNEMSILELIIGQLKKAGFTHVTICINHMANLIMNFIGCGEKWDITIDYSLEEKPLGTVGPLTLIKDLPEDFLVMNGDLLCNVDYAEFYNYHLKNSNHITIASFRRKTKIDFGVIEFSKDNHINSFVEKPDIFHNVSMGIYCFSRREIESLPVAEPLGLDNFIIDRIQTEKKIGAYQFNDFWLDIGKPEEYDYCNENFELIQKKLGLV